MQPTGCLAAQAARRHPTSSYNQHDCHSRQRRGAVENRTESGAMTPENLFRGIPSKLFEELLTTLHQASDLRIERIVSQGHRSPPGFWYDQDDAEWVIVIQGDAMIEFENRRQPVELRPGSYLNVPAHAKHRVASTNPTEQTIWLAIHYRG